MDKKIVADFIEAEIAPMLKADGGDIELVEIKDDNTVMVKLKGACGSCPFSQMTLKAGVETALKEKFPEVKSVESV